MKYIVRVIHNYVNLRLIDFSKNVNEFTKQNKHNLKSNITPRKFINDLRKCVACECYYRNHVRDKTEHCML